MEANLVIYNALDSWLHEHWKTQTYYAQNKQLNSPKLNLEQIISSCYNISRHVWFNWVLLVWQFEVWFIADHVFSLAVIVFVSSHQNGRLASTTCTWQLVSNELFFSTLFIRRRWKQKNMGTILTPSLQSEFRAFFHHQTYTCKFCTTPAMWRWWRQSDGIWRQIFVKMLKLLFMKVWRWGDGTRASLKIFTHCAAYLVFSVTIISFHSLLGMHFLSGEIGKRKHSDCYRTDWKYIANICTTQNV